MRKILYISNVAGQRLNVSFCKAPMDAAEKLDIDFSFVANRNKPTREQVKADEEKYGIHLYHIDLSRSPFSFQNIIAYKQLVDLIKKERFDVIHCNTPVGGILGRLAGVKCGVKKVVYQVHGFHFYKGAPKINWLLYYPIEKWLARMTDALITINKEDYELAKEKIKLRGNGKVYYVPGVGIDLSIYHKTQEARNLIRAEIGITDRDIMVVSAGRLDRNKNNDVIIKALAELDKKVHFVLCGDGKEFEDLNKLSRDLKVSSRVHFLGVRSDMINILNAADVFVLASFREGLSRSIMEAMACGLPVLCSDIRGNRDLIIPDKGGYMFDPYNVNDVVMKFESLLETNFREMGLYNLEYVKNFSLDNASKSMFDIYRKELCE